MLRFSAYFLWYGVGKLLKISIDNQTVMKSFYQISLFLIDLVKTFYYVNM